MLTVLKYFRLILSFTLFIAIVVLSAAIFERSQYQQIRKYDDANINHMKYGLFNVNSWKDKLTDIMLKEIRDFKLNESNKDVLKSHIETQLGGLIDKVDARIRESNKESTVGWLKQQFLEFFVDVKEIKKGIPGYADTIVKEMTKENAQKQFKAMIKQKVNEYVAATFEPQDMSEVNSIIKRVGAKNEAEAIAMLRQTVAEENKNLFNLTWILIALSAALFLVSGYHRKRLPSTYFILCLLTLVILLFIGVTCPMIDMDAKIKEFGFSLLGYHVQFDNQVVYFQSKSIMDVFWILISDPKLQMKLVGVFLVMFSIVFPLTKFISSIAYYYNIYDAQNNRIVRFFVLKSAKWSITDVQIAAIMMAYIGFNGMVTSQFNTLRETIPQFIFISTNGTTLQIGFYIFLSYVVLALIFSTLIEKTPKKM